MKNLLILKTIPILLNKLYQPIIRNGRPSIIKNKKAKEFIQLVQMEAIRQKIKKIDGEVSFKCDVLIKDRKNYDIDSVIKLLFDSLNGIAYKDDKFIVELIVRKHTNAEFDGLNILIEEVDNEQNLH
ncbi:RusA family crossover junction endodeoxyribonuclease [Arcobacter arenosus]|uniref:RusA family crossover junction endodeoxyribonuclease n=1 Tax=Arcobacter arenosus TaxID=2576037 RepID=A0A5R8Y5D8_9BACT|nr:RusA family crossover junction endodeoxyribonuclease [Arcobacter arenosus]TLP41051.1 RusA family crossover junction endodeoxyribonuclease [Arcobacter arenosus]